MIKDVRMRFPARRVAPGGGTGQGRYVVLNRASVVLT